MATKTKSATKFHSYTFHAKAFAAHFQFTRDKDDDFGPEFALSFHGRTPFRGKEKTRGHQHEEFSFTRSWAHVVTRKGRGGVYTTVARAGLRNLNVKGKVTADEIEAGIMAVYREEWFGEKARRRSPRILPLPPVFKNLKICGEPYRLGKELMLPEAFEFSDVRRKEYFEGEGKEIEPIEVSAAVGKREKLPCGEVAISKDTRRIEVPDFGIVTFADWKWLPRDIHTHEHTAQLVQLIGLELKNPGSGGGGGVIVGGKGGT
ncbi:MAG TPA: hypothetical protein VK335_21040 [Bryobacteraceae bacterium]|nr:hypothetical protein [Bryobacteraceae bacterium]